MDETPLTPKQKHDLCLVAQVGCDRTTARYIISASVAQLQAELQRDPEFAQELRRAEAMAELKHIRNVDKAAHHTKDWRISAWWLERRARERFGRRDPRILSPLEWNDVLCELKSILGGELAEADVKLRDRVLDRLTQLAAAAGPSDFEPPLSTPLEGDARDDLP